MRTLMLLVAVCALAIVVYRVWDEGLDVHWALLRLRFGNTAMRRAVVADLQEAAPHWALNWFGTPRTVVEQARATVRAKRRTELLVPSLVEVANKPEFRDDPDLYRLLSSLLTWYGTPRSVAQGRDMLLNALRHPEPKIRLIAIDGLPALVGNHFDETNLVARSTEALTDPNAGVRTRAVNNLLVVALRNKRALREGIRASLTHFAEEHPMPDVRARALSSLVALSMSMPSTPDDTEVLAIALKALNDPVINVRSWAVELLSREYPMRDGRRRVLWSNRNSEITRTLMPFLREKGQGLRAYAALGLVRRGAHGPEIWSELDKATRYNDLDGRGEFSAARDLCRDMQFVAFGLQLP